MTGRRLNFAGAQASSARNRGWNRGWDSNRNAFAARRRSFENWYVYNYPPLPAYGYPYVIDPGFYDWDDSDSSASDNSVYDQSDAAPYPDYGYGAPGEAPEEGFPAESAQGPQRAAAGLNSGPAAPSTPGQALTVIFKSGRTPVKMQNYMMTAKVLTDLDSRHYEQIPIDQIDVSATQWANSAVGVRFEIPGASSD